MRGVWSRFLPHARIRTRVVAAVVVAMSTVLVCGAAFVYWRVSFALDRQLDQDLGAYTELITRAVRVGDPLPADNRDQASQIYTRDGELTGTSDPALIRLLTKAQAGDATSVPKRVDLGHTIVPADHPYRLLYFTVDTPTGQVVVATAISRHKHDEALRELLLQLAIADLATILAAAVVGWAAVRASLGPVERYRRAALAAGGDPTRRLPIDGDRDDELTRLGTTFNALLQEIEESQLRERQFLADASHELRSPLALMAAEVEWARHRPRTLDELSTALDSFGNQTQRLIQLSNALLDLEEATSTEPRRTVVRADLLVEGALAELAEQATLADRTIQIQAPAVEVRVDQRWVGLMIANLVANALKHGTGTIVVAIAVLEPEAPVLRLDVTDEGGGIPAELGTRAFDRFARGDASRSTPGSGLGLALVAAVAHRHGGSARLVPGGVQVDLPCA